MDGPVRLRVIAAFCCALALNGALAAAGAAEKGLPLPRFASLKSDEVNLRVGPGDGYEIDWVLTRKGLPVEIIDERDVWRRIRDWQGTVGWVHERLVTGVRTVLVTGEVRVLRAEPEATARPVARAEPGLIAKLIECRGPWCRIEAQGVKGWLHRAEMWGVGADEKVP